MPLFTFAVVMTAIAIVLLTVACYLVSTFNALAREYSRYKVEQYADEREVWKERDAYQAECLYYHSRYGAVSPEELAAWEEAQYWQQWDALYWGEGELLT